MNRLFIYFYLLCMSIEINLIARELLDNNKENDIENEELVLLDSIAVLRTGGSGLSPTYYSDSWLLSPFGLVKTLEEIVIQNIWIAYGNEHGIKITSDGAANEYAEQYFDMLQEKKGVSRKQIEEMTREFGYTIDDVKKELNNQYLVQQTIETFFAASGKLNISNDEVVEFYNNFPAYEEASFIIESGVLPLEDSLKIDMKDENIKNKILWSNKPYLVLEQDLNDNFANINNCEINEIIYYEYIKNKKEFSCYRLLEKKEIRKISFNESYEEITRRLQSIKYEEGYKQMTEKFLLSSNIIYEDNKVKENCIDYLKK